METPAWPAFGQVLQYLRSLGFTTATGPDGFVVATHPGDDVSVEFRDRDTSSPARETELLTLKTQLTYRGFVSDEEFARFWNRNTRPAPATVEKP